MASFGSVLVVVLCTPMLAVNGISIKGFVYGAGGWSAPNATFASHYR
jgi:hypothetical protein